MNYNNGWSTRTEVDPITGRRHSRHTYRPRPSSSVDDYPPSPAYYNYQDEFPSLGTPRTGQYPPPPPPPLQRQPTQYQRQPTQYQRQPTVRTTQYGPTSYAQNLQTPQTVLITPSQPDPYYRQSPSQPTPAPPQHGWRIPILGRNNKPKGERFRVAVARHIQSLATNTELVSNLPKGTIYSVGLEFELLLTPRSGFGLNSMLRSGFAKKLVAEHNTWVAANNDNYKKMNDHINEENHNNYTRWSLENDGSLRSSGSQRGVEIVSPVFRAFPESKWRYQLGATWAFLEAHYIIKRDKRCSTHVHVSLPTGYQLKGLKRVAQAVIHFEPAFEALLPKSRGGHIYYARSNWLNNPSFYKTGRSRKEAMDDIAACDTLAELVHMMNPNCKYYGFNFRHVNASADIGTIEFRRGLATGSKAGALKWAEVASSFIYAAYHSPDREAITRYSANVGGLKDWIEDAKLPNGPGSFFKKSLKGFFQDKPRSARASPGIMDRGINSSETLSSSDKENMRRMLEQDRSYR